MTARHRRGPDHAHRAAQAEDRRRAVGGADLLQRGGLGGWAARLPRVQPWSWRGRHVPSGRLAHRSRRRRVARRQPCANPLRRHCAEAHAGVRGRRTDDPDRGSQAAPAHLPQEPRRHRGWKGLVLPAQGPTGRNRGVRDQAPKARSARGQWR